MSHPDPWLLDQIRDQLRQALESMTGESPVLQDSSSSPADPLFWWEQSFSAGPLAKVWIGAGEAAWQEIGGRTLRAAGIEEAPAAEVQGTYQEILSQVMSGVASAVGSRIGSEVSCASGTEAPPPTGEKFFDIAIEFASGSPAVLRVAYSEAMSALLAPTQVPARRDPVPASESHVLPAVESSKTLDLLLEVELPVSVSFGRAHLRLKDVIKLSTGSIVELNRSVSEPVEVIVNNCVIARAEVVVIEGYYGVRIQQIISRQERLRTLA